MRSRLLHGALASLLLVAACDQGGGYTPPAAPPNSRPVTENTVAEEQLSNSTTETPVPPPAPEPAPAPEPTPEPAPAPASDGGLPAFNHQPPGGLVAGSGAGVTDATLWSPTMRFPIEKAPAYANSQVWGAGGLKGGGGSQCDARNYSYAWRDNFCETRTSSTATNLFCASGKGHQGQDIRPATCKQSLYWAVAAEAGQITQIGTYTVFLTADSGILYRYLHMDMVKVRQTLKVGDRLAQGDRIGLVSHDFGATPTTIHLHFEMKAPVSKNGQSVFTFVPPYSSLVLAYQRLLLVSPDAPR